MKMWELNSWGFREEQGLYWFLGCKSFIGYSGKEFGYILSMSPEPEAELVSHRLMGSEEGIPRQDRTRGGVELLLGTLFWSIMKTATRGAEKGEGIC